MNEKNQKRNVFVLMLILAIGMLFVLLDFKVGTPFKYPNDYSNSDEIIGEYQYYTLDSNYGATCTYKMIASGGSSEDTNPEAASQTGTSTSTETVKVIDKVFFKNISVDVLNDFVGFILIFIACLILSRCARTFLFASACAACGFLLKGVLAFLPYFVNGFTLCTCALVIGLFYLACTLATIYMCAKGLFAMCPGVSCRDERKWCQIMFFVIFTLKILVVLIYWAGSDFTMLYRLGQFFAICLIVSLIIFWRIWGRTHVFMTEFYIESCKKRLVPKDAKS